VISDLLILILHCSVGRISDLWGRKVVLFLSILGTFISYSLLLISSEPWIFFLSRIIVGLFKNTETSCYSIVTDISTSTTRVKRLAYIGSAIGFGFILGPALSGILTSSYSLETPAYVSSIMLLCNSIITLILLPETMSFRNSTYASPYRVEEKITSPNRSSKLEREDFKSELVSLNDEIIDELGSPIDLMHSSSELLRSSDIDSSFIEKDIRSPRTHVSDVASESLSIWKLLLKPNPLRNLVWVYFGTSMAIMIFQGSSVLLLQLLGMSVQATSWIISYSGFLTVLSSLVIQYLTSHYSEKQLLLNSILVVSISLFGTIFVLIHPSITLAGLLIAYIPLTLGARTLKNCLIGLVTQQAPSSQTGTIIGLLNSLESLCRALTPLIGGILMQIFVGGPALASSIISFGFYIWIRRNTMNTLEIKAEP
jgi:MFS family permease